MKMDANVLKARREALRKSVKVQVIAVAGNLAVQKANDCSYPFAQDAHFLYLTGIEEAGWHLIMAPDGEWLVAPHRSEAGLLFDGGLSLSDALQISGVDAVLSIDEAEARLKAYAEAHAVVGTIGPDPYKRHYEFVLNPGPVRYRRKLQKLFGETVDIRHAIGKLRAIKSADEVAMIRRAVAATTEAFRDAARALPALRTEYELEAFFTHAFARHHLQHAYDPIVAAGINACTLHYVKNGAPLPKNGLVLLDIGARYNGYCADVTRTFLIGTPTPREQAVVKAVQKAQREIITLLKPGLSFKEYQQGVNELMREALQSLGLDASDAGLNRYFPHAVSHGLGLDVHDSLAGFTHFEAGMVVTVEPGIYIPDESIGVRIEDDILITEDGCENLSAAMV